MSLPKQVEQQAWELSKRETAVKEAESAVRLATERLSDKEIDLAGRERNMLDRETEIQAVKVSILVFVVVTGICLWDY